MLFATNMIASKYLSLASCTISSFSKQLSVILPSRMNFFYSYDHYFYATLDSLCSPGWISQYKKDLEEAYVPLDHLRSPSLKWAILLQIHHSGISGFLVYFGAFWDYYSLDCDLYSNHRNSLSIWCHPAR